MEIRSSFLVHLLFLLFLISLVLGGVVATAQPSRSKRSTTKVRWLHFARGESNAVMSGKLDPYKADKFRFRAAKGQKLLVKVTSTSNRFDTDADVIVFWIQSKAYLHDGRRTRILPGIANNGVSDWEGTVPADGDYEIIVSNPPIGDPVKRRTPYTLEVRIE